MYETYKDKGFEILAFPANNFGQQEPGSNEEIKGSTTKYSVGFPSSAKISVKGDDKHPLYRYLTEQSPFPVRVEMELPEIPGRSFGPCRRPINTARSPLAQDIVMTSNGFRKADRLQAFFSKLM